MRFTDKLAARDMLVLDGALSTELEKRGCDLNQSLWSAGMLDQHPDLIRDVHRVYLEAGADCITSASYQASLPGFRAAGFTQQKSEELYRQSIRLAYAARNSFCQERGIASDSLEAPLVAISIGPYGAFLADGSEYRGRYQVSDDELARFHEDRIALALDELQQHTDQPLLAFETIPSLPEALVLLKALVLHPVTEAWLSFSCATGSETCEGQAISQCMATLDAGEELVAVGVNCTRPQLLNELIPQFAVSHRPVIAYPNAGGVYDSNSKEWQAGDRLSDTPDAFDQWANAGATVLGGCCRSSPEWISELVAWRDQRLA
jgi:homocysteine S-methyltransferase